MEPRFGALAASLPRPGKVLRGLLGAVLLLGLGNAILFNWASETRLFEGLAFLSDKLEAWQVWRLVTAGLLTRPTGPGAVSGLLFTLLALYFLTTDIEARWGPWRFLRFLVVTNCVGFLLGYALDRIAPHQVLIFHPPIMYGAGAMITGTTIAWARENADKEVRLFFFLPVRGRHLFWLAILYCVLAVLYWDPAGDAGVVVPFGGIFTGLLMSGSPSVVRRAYLTLKLAVLRRQGATLSSADVLSRRAGPASGSSRRRSSGPPLRVVPGGLEDELKKRPPPKDKRYLN